MTGRDLVESLDGLRWIAAHPRHVVDVLRRSPPEADAESVLRDLVNLARVIGPILAAWPAPGLAELGFTAEPLQIGRNHWN